MFLNSIHFKYAMFVPFCTQVKFTEEARRERQRRAEAGDQKCMLRYTPPATQTPPPPRPVPW